MASLIYFSNIRRHLLTYAQIIEQSNSLGLTDETLGAENFFCIFLNHAFGWQLKNANEAQKNQDTFDLIDTKNKLAIQVTSNKRHSEKLKKTVLAFKKKHQRTNIKQLIILFISSKCTDAVLKKVRTKEFSYEGYDIPKLLKDIFFKNKLPSQLKVLNQMLEEVSSPVLMNGSFPLSQAKDISTSIPIQSSIITKKGIYIERRQLMGDIFSFGQVGNGLLIGGPGTGKSFIIDELQAFCKKKKIHCFVIRINELLYGSDDEIKKEFKTNCYWINALRNLSSNNQSAKSLLIFDAFDTAKDEKIKSAILKQIKDAIKELSAEWGILVSARTFDAAKSSRLLELFPQINILKEHTCRYLEIPELSEKEFTEAINKNKKFERIVQKSTKELKRLLRTLYFLKLFEKVINESNDFQSRELINIETEEQLLEIFWNKKIRENTQTDLFLRQITLKLTEKENLSLEKSSVVTPQNISDLENLLSLGILSESSATKQNLSFSHNILLEFAISKYIIPEEINDLIAYITDHQKLPFLFRQSFVYFYSRVWKVDNSLFWTHYFNILKKNSPLFRLYHQTILNYILAGYYRNISELQPVFDLKNDEQRNQTIRKILEGIRFMTKGVPREKDILLFYRITRYLSDVVLWELGFLIDKGIRQAKEGNDKRTLSLLAKTSAAYLNFVLSQRKISLSKHLIEHNGSTWGINNLCATLPYGKTFGRKLVTALFQILKEPEFSIRFFLFLADNIFLIFEHDKNLGLSTYKTLYFHVENSDKETILGSSSIMSLRSNRRQDFESIYYKLESHYKKILPLYPAEAIPLGLQIVNKFSIDRKHYRKIKTPYLLSINGIKAKLFPDYSFYASEHDKEYGPLSHAESIFNYFEKLATENKSIKALTLTKIFIQNAEASLLWRKLMDLFKRHPAIFKKEAFSLLMNEAIFICNETVYESAELIKVLWPLLSDNNKTKLETAILKIPYSRFTKNDAEFLASRVIRLLSTIPVKEIRKKESLEFINKLGIKENKPLISRPTLMGHQSSRDEKIENMGIDPANEYELHIYELTEKLEPFNSKYDYNNNDKPPKNEYKPLLKIADELLIINKTHSFSNDKLKFNCDYEVSRFCKLISRHGSKLSKSLRHFIQNTALYYLEIIDYMSKVYEVGDIKNISGAYSATPRTAATQTIVQLLFSDKVGTLAPVLLNLVSDNTQIVRFKALHAFTFYWHHNRTEFWKKVFERCEREKDGMCLHKVIYSLHYDDIITVNQTEAENVAGVIVNNLKDADEDIAHEVWHVYIVILLKLCIKYKSHRALNIVYENLNIKGFSRQLIFEILTVIDPHDSSNNYVNEPDKYQDLVKVLHTIVEYRFASLKTNGLKSSTAQDDFKIIDLVIQHLYFAVESGKKSNKGKKLLFANKAAFLSKIKPLLKFITCESEKLESGFMVAHTGYYFMQLMNVMLSVDAEYALTLSSSIVQSSAANGFTYDQTTLSEVVKLTERILADHKVLLNKKEHFENMIIILDLFANSGWQEALELTWRLKDVF